MIAQTHLGPRPVFSSCPHRSIQVIQTGGMHFSEGQVWDDIKEQVLCLDCLEVLSEADVRSAWTGNNPINETYNMEKCHDYN